MTRPFVIPSTHMLGGTDQPHMRVTACPSDRHAVGWYRLGQPATVLADQGESIDFAFLPGLPLNVHKITGQPVGLADDFDTDILILQRPMAAWQLIGLQSAQQRGIRVIVELDDAFHAVDRRSTFGQNVRPEHLRVLTECCQRADLITVSTPALVERYAPHGRVVVLPNYVDERWLDINPLNECMCTPCVERSGDPCTASPVIGWTGSIGNHVADLDATCGGVGLALTETEGTLRCWGDGNQKASVLIRQSLHLTQDPDIQPWQPRDQYPHHIAQLTAGIAPLADTAFNQAKSWLKPLEMAACGVPCIMSPTVEYQRLHDEHGIGILAGWRSRDWKKATIRLLTDHAYRAEQAEQGRQAVRDGLTIQQHAWRWAEAWASALERAAAAA